MSKRRKTAKRKPSKSMMVASPGEQRLLGYLNAPLPPLRVLTDEVFAGVRITVEDASRIIETRTSLGGFTDLQQVLDIEGIDSQGFIALRSVLEPVPYQATVPDDDLAAFVAFWDALPASERSNVSLVHPGFTPQGGAEAYYTTAAGGALGLEVPAELVWREFWKRVMAWLAKRGLIIGGLAVADGPLPIGDLIALGLTIWMILELIELWEILWKEAVLAASISELAKKAWELVPAIEEHISVKLPGQSPCTYLWHYYIKEIIAKLKALLEKIGKIPPGKKAAELAQKLKEMVDELINTVRERAPEAIDDLEQSLRDSGLLK